MGKNDVLTKQEVDAFLQQPVVARLATVRPDGWPYVAPVWQYWDGEAMWIVPREKSAFVSYLRAEPRVCVSVALETAPYTRVTLLGRAEIVEGPVDGRTGTPQWVGIARQMSRRYLGEHGPEYLEPTMDRPRYLVRITPVRMRTWEGVEWHEKYKPR
jgi:PPOX class probable F420-dependent enzyme